MGEFKGKRNKKGNGVPRPSSDNLAPDWLGYGKNTHTGFIENNGARGRKYYGEWGEFLNEEIDVPTSFK